MTLKINKPEINIREEISKISNKVTFDEVVRGLGQYAGNVGIGTTSPTATLDIVNTSNTTAESYGLSVQGGGNSTGSGYSLRALDQSGNVDFFVRGDGNVGIGTASPGTKLHVDGVGKFGVPTGGSTLFSWSQGQTTNVNQPVIALVTNETNNQDRVRFNSDGDSWFNGGNVGIGTTTPEAKLTVAQSGTIGGKDLTKSCFLAGTSSTGIGIDDNEIIKKQGANGGQLNIGSQGINSSIKFKTGANTDVNSATYEMAFDRMTIDSDGNVGIGTDSPNEALHVNGNIQLNNWVRTIGDMIISADFDNNNNNSSIRFNIDGNDVADEKMRIASNGNVGIGTTGPGHQLEVACDSSEYNMYAITEHNGAGWGGLVGGKMEYTLPGSNSASSRTWSMGKYRPTDTVHPATTITLKSRDNGTAFLWMDDANVLRFGTSSSNVGSSTGTSLGTALTSDERAKNIESGFEYGLDHVMQLQPIAFAFKKDAKQTRTLGFGASASQEIIPESVFDTGNCVDGYNEHPEHEGMNQPKSDDTELGMDYVQLIPVLTKAIQEQQQIIEDLKSRIETLESK